MTGAGIDIGSRTIKVVVVRDGGVIYSKKTENTFDTLAACRHLLDGIKYDTITATGYGRNLFAEHSPCTTISEIKAFSLGAAFMLPTCRTVLDIGGQDTKVIALDEKGRMKKFEMNDKFAAGTGRFLEIMAMALGFRLDDFGREALSANGSVQVSSMCAVFAESEVVSLIAHGAERKAVANGVHRAVANRAATLLGRVSAEDDILFAGGVAYNPCIHQMLCDQLKKKVHVTGDPQIIGAIGAALHSLDSRSGVL